MLHFVVDIKMCSPLGFSRSIRDTSDVMLEACLQQDKSTPLQSPAGVVADNEAITESKKSCSDKSIKTGQGSSSLSEMKVGRSRWASGWQWNCVAVGHMRPAGDIRVLRVHQFWVDLHDKFKEDCRLAEISLERWAASDVAEQLPPSVRTLHLRHVSSSKITNLIRPNWKWGLVGEVIELMRVWLPLKISWKIFKWSSCCFKVGRKQQWTFGW